LRQDIRVRTDSGQAAQLKSASIDFKAGTVVSREPVTVTFPNGMIEADSLEVSDNGKVIVFKGRVRTVLERAEEPTVTASTPSPAPENLVQPAQVLSFETQPASLRP
jgi:lipopolysaccharide export system protein LptC